MSSLEDQVSHLREQVLTTRSDAAAARVLAGGADRDVAAFGAKLDAHTRTLNALRETQVEQGELLREHGQRLNGHGQLLREQGELLREQSQLVGDQSQLVRDQNRRIDSLEREVRTGFTTLGAGMAQITALLTGTTGADQE